MAGAAVMAKSFVRLGRLMNLTSQRAVAEGTNLISQRAVGEAPDLNRVAELADQLAARFWSKSKAASSRQRNFGTSRG